MILASAIDSRILIIFAKKIKQWINPPLPLYIFIAYLHDDKIYFLNISQFHCENSAGIMESLIILVTSMELHGADTSHYILPTIMC